MGSSVHLSTTWMIMMLSSHCALPQCLAQQAKCFQIVMCKLSTHSYTHQECTSGLNILIKIWLSIHVLQSYKWMAAIYFHSTHYIPPDNMQGTNSKLALH